MKLSTSTHNRSGAMGAMFGGFARMAMCSAVAIPALMITISGASAQETTKPHLDAARAAIDASRVSAPLDGILPQAAITTKSTIIAARPDMADIISDVVDDVAIALASRRGDLENEVALIYTRVFSQEELTSIATFYASEAGKKLLTEAPIIERQIKEASRTWSAGIRRDLNLNVRKKLSELV